MIVTTKNVLVSLMNFSCLIWSKCLLICLIEGRIKSKLISFCKQMQTSGCKSCQSISLLPEQTWQCRARWLHWDQTLAKATATLVWLVLMGHRSRSRSRGWPGHSSLSRWSQQPDLGRKSWLFFNWRKSQWPRPRWKYQLSNDPQRLTTVSLTSYIVIHSGKRLSATALPIVSEVLKGMKLQNCPGSMLRKMVTMTHKVSYTWSKFRPPNNL